MDANPFYTNTCQCKFWHKGEWRFGIVYKSIVIDAQNGEVFWTKDLVNESIKAGRIVNEATDDWITEYNWLDLTKHYINEGVKQD